MYTDHITMTISAIPHICRIVWFFLICAAYAYFFYMLVLRVQLLNSSPKGVNVEVIYNDDLEFPAVTLCNQNFFRLVFMHFHCDTIIQKSHEWGL